MKYFDIKPVCPNWHNHRHLRRVLDTFPQAFVGDRVVMLKVDHPHVCEARVIIESDVDLAPKRQLDGISDELLASLDLALPS